MHALSQPVMVGKVAFGGGDLVLIAGPCLIEDEAATYDMACYLRDLTAELGMPYVFKASYDKANRTAVTAVRGPGWQIGLELLARVKERAGVPVLSDVHETGQVGPAAAVLDVLQVPAFLCRQTDLLVACGETQLPVNIKKGQFMAPADMAYSVEKVRSTGNDRVLLTERGTTFGYHNLVVDMRSLAIMRGLGVPVIFDATHSVQLPGGAGGASGGQREYAAGLARSAVAMGIDSLFLEVHPDPDHAPCDGPNMIPFGDLRALLRSVQAVHEVVRAL
ncbi:MAG: 3-deoxy-8-phosphooctulonate synthase [Armatimonadetes bacterium]|nr:3-deoxy-8-phosphooctulonate synthase [Armatimonadota bacterium]